MNIEEYITTLTEQIRCKKARPGVAQEIRNHILDQMQVYEQDGMEHEKAVEAAVREMGDPVETGVALDHIHRPQFDWRLFVMTVLFSFAGIFLMELTGALGQDRGLLLRQCLFTFAGIGVVLFICFVDYTVVAKYALPIYILMSIAFIVYYKTGTRVNGCIPAFRSLAYLYIPVYAGILYHYRGKSRRNIVKALLFLIVTAFLAAQLAVSMFIGFGVGAICTVLFLYAFIKGWFGKKEKRLAMIISVFVSVLAIFAVYILFFAYDYQKMRIIAFLNQNNYQQTENFLLTLTRSVHANAQIIGGNAQTVLEEGLVYNNTFLILTQSVAMYGMIAGAAMIAAFALLGVCAFRIVKHQKNQFGMLLSAACFLLVIYNCIIGVLMNFGLYPLGTLQFPFLTRGGSATFMYAVIIGLLMSCNRYEKIIDVSAQG